MAEWLWRVAQASCFDGQTYLDFSWGNPRGFESHSFHQLLLDFLGTAHRNNICVKDQNQEERKLKRFYRIDYRESALMR